MGVTQLGLFPKSVLLLLVASVCCLNLNCSMADGNENPMFIKVQRETILSYGTKYVFILPDLDN